MYAHQGSINQTILMPYTTSIMKESLKWLFAPQLRSGKGLLILILMVLQCQMTMMMEVLLLFFMYAFIGSISFGFPLPVYFKKFLTIINVMKMQLSVGTVFMFVDVAVTF